MSPRIWRWNCVLPSVLWLEYQGRRKTWLQSKTDGKPWFSELNCTKNKGGGAWGWIPNLAKKYLWTNWIWIWGAGKRNLFCTEVSTWLKFKLPCLFNLIRIQNWKAARQPNNINEFRCQELFVWAAVFPTQDQTMKRIPEFEAPVRGLIQCLLFTISVCIVLGWDVI